MPSLFAHLNKQSYFLLWAMAFALLVRMILFICYTQYENYKITIDSDQYQEVAFQICKGNGISMQNGQPNFFRLPAYPIFLGNLYKIFGPYPKKILPFQIALSTLILPLIFALSCTFFPGHVLVAKVATIAAAAHPGFILFSELQATETLFLIFFLIFLIFFFNGIERNKISFFCIAGGSLGVASLFRALGHYVIVLAIAIIFLSSNQTHFKKFSSAITFFLSWLSIFGIWLVRNYILTGFIFIHTLTGQHFLRYNAVHILMDAENVDWTGPHKRLFDLRDKMITQQEAAENRKLSEPEKDQLAFKLAFQIIWQHPFLAIKNACKQVITTCFSLYSFMTVQLPPGTIFDQNTSTSFKIKMYLSCLKEYPILIFFILWDMFFSFMLLIGMGLFFLLCFKDPSFKKICLFALPMIVLLVGITLSYGCSRLRFPIEPFIIILAAYGLTSYWQEIIFKKNVLKQH